MKLLPEFESYAKVNDVELLKDDIRFLEDKIGYFPRELHKWVLKAYIDRWVSIQRVCTDVIASANLGRFNANSMICCLVGLWKVGDLSREMFWFRLIEMVDEPLHERR